MAFGQELDPKKVYAYPCLAPYGLDDFDSLNAGKVEYQRFEIVNFKDTIIIYFGIRCLIQDDSTYLRVQNLCNEKYHYNVNGKPFLLIRHPKDVFFEGISFSHKSDVDNRIRTGTYHPLTIFETNLAEGRFIFMLKDFPDFCCKYDSEETFLKIIEE